MIEAESIKWIDSHFHPQCEPLSINTIQEALDNNIEKMCCIGTKLSEINFLLECKNRFNIPISLGEHPENDIANIDWTILEANIHNLSAIGEIGFDYQSSLDKQIKLFDIQASIAVKHNLPVILHVRDSGNGEVEDLIIKKLNQYSSLKGVFHCFVGSERLANFAIQKGFFISFSGIITFKNAEYLRALLQMIPLELMLIETDAPYLAPVPKRGKTNHPMYVKYTGEFIANHLDIDNREFAKILSNNFDILYNFK